MNETDWTHKLEMQIAYNKGFLAGVKIALIDDRDPSSEYSTTQDAETALLHYSYVVGAKDGQIAIMKKELEVRRNLNNSFQ